MASLVVLKDERPFLRFRLEKEDTTIGRQSQADIYLPDARTSRGHAIVRRTSDGYQILDRSTNGTYVNGVRTRAARLKDQDIITIGSCQIRFELETTTEPPPTVAVGPEGGALSYDARGERFFYVRPVLMVSDGKRPPRRIPLHKEVLTVGSRPDADIRIHEPGERHFFQLLSVSETQFALRRFENADVSVDDRPVRGDVAVSPGTTIRVGKTFLKLLIEEGEDPLMPVETSLFEGMVGTTPRMHKLFGLIARFAQHDAPVIILGETGTGKELVARALHARSHRSRGPFIAINCSAISPHLVESELFGHERGAFTGADRARKGAIEAADGGVLFLDELGDMPLEAQAKLLRVLETRTVTPVGSFEPRPVDIRVVAATHQDLLGAVEAGRFRRDLFFRLLVLPIELPPLRERKGEIPSLVRHFLSQMGVDGRVPRITEAALQRLVAYDWPGNIRELRHVLVRALATNDRGVIDEKDLVFLSPSLRSRDKAGSIPPRVGTLAEMEKREIERALRLCNNNRQQAARVLGIARSTLHMRMKKHGLV